MRIKKVAVIMIFPISKWSSHRAVTERHNIFIIRPAGTHGVSEIWDPDFAKRKKMKELLDKLIPEFSVRLGGTTSVDITKPGIDKA